MFFGFGGLNSGFGLPPIFNALIYLSLVRFFHLCFLCLFVAKK